MGKKVNAGRPKDLPDKGEPVFEPISEDECRPEYYQLLADSLSQLPDKTAELLLTYLKMPPARRLERNLKETLGFMTWDNVKNFVREGVGDAERQALLDTTDLPQEARTAVHYLFNLHERYLLWQRMRKTINQVRTQRPCRLLEDGTYGEE